MSSDKNQQEDDTSASLEFKAKDIQDITFDLSNIFSSYISLFPGDVREKIFSIFENFLLENADFESFPPELVNDFQKLTGINPIEYKKELQGGAKEEVEQKIKELKTKVNSGVSNPLYQNLVTEIEQNLEEFPNLKPEYNAIFTRNNNTRKNNNLKFGNTLTQKNINRYTFSNYNMNFARRMTQKKEKTGYNNNALRIKPIEYRESGLLGGLTNLLQQYKEDKNSFTTGSVVLLGSILLTLASGNLKTSNTLNVVKNMNSNSPQDLIKIVDEVASTVPENKNLLSFNPELNETLVKTIAEQISTPLVEEIVDSYIPEVQSLVIQNKTIFNLDLQTNETQFIYIDENGFPVTPKTVEAEFVQVPTNITKEIVNETLQNTLKVYVDPVNENVFDVSYTVDGETKLFGVQMDETKLDTSISSNVISIQEFFDNSPFTLVKGPCLSLTTGGGFTSIGGNGEMNICLETKDTSDEVREKTKKNICIKKDFIYVIDISKNNPVIEQKIRINSEINDYNNYINIPNIEYDTSTEKFVYNKNYPKGTIDLTSKISEEMEQSDIIKKAYLTPQTFCIQFGDTTECIPVGNVEQKNIKWFQASTNFSKNFTYSEEETQGIKKIVKEIQNKFPFLEIKFNFSSSYNRKLSTYYYLKDSFKITNFKESINIIKSPLGFEELIYFQNDENNRKLFIYNKVNKDFNSFDFKGQGKMILKKDDKTGATRNNIQKIKNTLQEKGLHYDIFVLEDNKLFFNIPLQKFVDKSLQNQIKIELEEDEKNEKNVKVTASFGFGQKIIGDSIAISDLSTKQSQIISEFCDKSKIFKFNKRTKTIEIAIENNEIFKEDLYENVSSEKFVDTKSGYQVLKPKQGIVNKVFSTLGLANTNFYLVFKWEIVNDKKSLIQFFIIPETFMSDKLGETTKNLNDHNIPLVYDDITQKFDEKKYTEIDYQQPLISYFEATGKNITTSGELLPRLGQKMINYQQQQKQNLLPGPKQNSSVTTYIDTKVTPITSTNVILAEMSSSASVLDKMLASGKYLSVDDKKRLEEHKKALDTLYVTNATQESTPDFLKITNKVILKTVKDIFKNTELYEVKPNDKKVLHSSYKDNYLLVSASSKEIQSIRLKDIDRFSYTLEENKIIKARIDLKDKNNNPIKILLSADELSSFLAKLITNIKGEKGDYTSLFYDLLPSNKGLKQQTEEYITKVIQDFLLKDQKFDNHIIRDFASSAIDKASAKQILDSYLKLQMNYMQERIFNEILSLQSNNLNDPNILTLKQSFLLFDFIKNNIASDFGTADLTQEQVAALAAGKQKEMEAQRSFFEKLQNSVENTLKMDFGIKEIIMYGAISSSLLGILFLMFKFSIFKKTGVAIIFVPKYFYNLLTRAFCKSKYDQNINLLRGEETNPQKPSLSQINKKDILNESPEIKQLLQSIRQKHPNFPKNPVDTSPIQIKTPFKAIVVDNTKKTFSEPNQEESRETCLNRLINEHRAKKQQNIYTSTTAATHGQIGQLKGGRRKKFSKTYKKSKLNCIKLLGNLL